MRARALPALGLLALGTTVLLTGCSGTASADAAAPDAAAPAPRTPSRRLPALAMTDRKLAQAYWRSHVSRRRAGMVAVLRAGIERGVLRPGIDVDACIDLVNGVFYYQFVVRGVTLDDPEALARCREGIRVAWRGMAAEGG